MQSPDFFVTLRLEIHGRKRYLSSDTLRLGTKQFRKGRYEEPFWTVDLETDQYRGTCIEDGYRYEETVAAYDADDNTCGWFEYEPAEYGEWEVLRGTMTLSARPGALENAFRQRAARVIQSAWRNNAFRFFRRKYMVDAVELIHGGDAPAPVSFDLTMRIMRMAVRSLIQERFA